MKLRICFLVDSIFSIGGVQRVTAVIAKELSKCYDVTIVTFDKPETKNHNVQFGGIRYSLPFHFLSIYRVFQEQAMQGLQWIIHAITSKIAMVIKHLCA